MRAQTTHPAAQGAVESVLEAGFIRGTGMAVPDRVVSNADLEKIVDTTDEWIRTRSGIRERRACEEGQNTADMAALAARRALESARVDPLDVDVLILSTATPDHLLPSTACETQARIGAHRAAAFDISAACAGWLYGLTIAHGLIRSGAHRHVLVVGAEKMSAIIDYSDRATCVLFGDGAGAALVGDDGSGLLASHIQTDGRFAQLLWRPAGGAVHRWSRPESTGSRGCRRPSPCRSARRRSARDRRSARSRRSSRCCGCCSRAPGFSTARGAARRWCPSPTTRSWRDSWRSRSGRGSPSRPRSGWPGSRVRGR